MFNTSTIEDLFFKLPLYNPVPLNESNRQMFLDLMHYQEKVDGYNPDLKQESTFKVWRAVGRSNEYDDYSYYVGKFIIELICVRDSTKFSFYFYVQSVEVEEDVYEYFLIKIGQYPSIADLEFSKLEKYSKIIKKSALHELKKAIGLAANGVGIGSFVYLRRVFENLIEEKHTDCKKGDTWNEEIYQKSKMDEKILLLKEKLPSLLVTHRRVYSIVSKGIHELSEQECLSYFEVLLDAIIMILEEDFRLAQEQKRLLEMTANLNKIQQNLKK